MDTLVCGGSISTNAVALKLRGLLEASVIIIIFNLDALRPIPRNPDLWGTALALEFF